MQPNNTIGERIKNARRLAGMTQKELAAMLGVASSMIGQYEIGARKPKLDTVQKIAKALDVSSDYLLGHSGQYSDLQETVFNAIFGTKKTSGGQTLVDAVAGLIPILSDLDSISNNNGESLNAALACATAVIDGLGDLFLLLVDEKRRIAADIPTSRSTSFIHDAINIKSVITEPISSYCLYAEDEIEGARVHSE